MRRWHGRYKEYGYDGLLDRRLGKPSPKRVPLAVVEPVFRLYREKYFDLEKTGQGQYAHSNVLVSPC
jgi:hypothetical protein